VLSRNEEAPFEKSSERKEKQEKKEGNEEQPTLSAPLAERVGHRPMQNIPYVSLGRFTGRTSEQEGC
jgi:hypothetical protein